MARFSSTPHFLMKKRFREKRIVKYFCKFLWCYPAVEIGHSNVVCITPHFLKKRATHREPCFSFAITQCVFINSSLLINQNGTRLCSNISMLPSRILSSRNFPEEKIKHYHFYNLDFHIIAIQKNGNFNNELTLELPVQVHGTLLLHFDYKENTVTCCSNILIGPRDPLLRHSKILDSSILCTW